MVRPKILRTFARILSALTGACLISLGMFFIISCTYSSFIGGGGAVPSIFIVGWLAFLSILVYIGWILIFNIAKFSLNFMLKSLHVACVAKAMWKFVFPPFVCLMIVLVGYAFCWLRSNFEYNEKTFLRWEYYGDEWHRIPLHYPYQISDNFINGEDVEGRNNVGVSVFTQSFASNVSFNDTLSEKLCNISSFTIISNKIFVVVRHQEKDLYICFDSSKGTSFLYPSKVLMENEMKKIRTGEKTYTKNCENWFEEAWNDYWRGH